MKYVQSLIDQKKAFFVDEVLDTVELVLELAPASDDHLPLLGDQLVQLLDLVQNIHVLLRLGLQLLVQVRVNFITPISHFFCNLFNS